MSSRPKQIQPSRHYNLPMFFSGDPRRRTVVFYASAFLLILIALGAFQAFNTTLPVRIWHYSFSVDFLNPETAGETLLSTALMVLVFLLLLLLLLLCLVWFLGLIWLLLFLLLTVLLLIFLLLLLLILILLVRQ